jgi:RNA recognition motif-containing protein
MSESTTDMFLGNLPFSLGEDDIRDLCEEYGTVNRINLIKDRETDRPRGFGFVSFATSEEANKASTALDGKEVDGRALRANLAEPRKPRDDSRGSYNSNSRG